MNKIEKEKEKSENHEIMVFSRCILSCLFFLVCFILEFFSLSSVVTSDPTNSCEVLQLPAAGHPLLDSVRSR